MASRPTGAAGLGAWLLLLAGACSPQKGLDPLALYPASPEGHMALLRGKLQMDGPCLYIVGEDGRRWLAAFPSPGIEWLAADQAVQVRGRVVKLGEMAAFTGGEAGSGDGLPWVRSPAEPCDGSPVWMITGVAAGQTGA